MSEENTDYYEFEDVMGMFKELPDDLQASVMIEYLKRDIPLMSLIRYWLDNMTEDERCEKSDYVRRVLFDEDC